MNFYTDKFKLCLYQNDDQMPYVLPQSFVMTPGWSEVTSIETLAFYTKYLLHTSQVPDWRFVRGWIKELVYEKIENDWANVSSLSAAELHIACEYLPNLVPTQILMETLSIDEIKEFSTAFNVKSKESRELRLRRAEEHAFGNWAISSCLWIVHETYTQSLPQMYVAGIEKSENDGYYGVWDWFEDLKSNEDLGTLITPTNPVPVTQTISNIQNLLIYGSL